MNPIVKKLTLTTLTILVIIIGSWLVLSNINSDQQVKENQLIKIGIILPLSGPAADLGESVKNAAQLAVRNLTNTKNRYKLLFEDDQADSKQTISAFRKLVNIHEVNAIVTVFSGPANAVAPLAEEKKLLTFAISSDMTVAKGKDFVFNHWIKPENEAREYVKYAREQNLNQIAMLTVNQPAGFAVRDALLQADPKLFILQDELFDIKEKDFRTSILKAKDKKADAFVFLLLPGQIAPAVRQIQELGFLIPITSIENFEYDEEAIPLLEGQWYINPDNPNNEFMVQFQKIYQTEPKVGSGNVYDAVQLIITAFEQSNDELNVVQILSQIQDFQGVMGNLIIDQDGNIGSRAVVKEIRGEEFVKLRD